MHISSIISRQLMPLEELAIIRLLLGNRITLPKDLIDDLGWKRGDRIRVFRKGDQVFLERVGLQRS